MNKIKAPIFAISRLRMGSDGPGVTTLVTFMGCPLKCKYCLNKKCHEPILEADGITPRIGIMMLTPEELYDIVKIDNIYFQATGGGICFGGGEPTLYSEFIDEFRRICNKQWKITLETCLRCSFGQISSLKSAVDYWIVDIKSYDSTIYEKYTGQLSCLKQSLASLSKIVPDENVIIKIPRIPEYNEEENLDKVEENITRFFGFTNFKQFEYKKI